MIAAARREPDLAALAQEVRAAGGQLDPCVLDVTDTAAVLATIQHWDDAVGGLDLVLANAGLGLQGPAHKLPWEKVEPVIKVNVLGAMATLMAVMPKMIERRHGTLAGVSSLAAMRGLPTSGAYSASKAALATFLETLRIDLAPKGVTVVDVRPGFIDTDMTKPNRFKMPFLMDVERAGRLAVEALKRGDAVAAFPWQLAKVMAVAEAMPDPLWRQIASRLKV